MRCCTTDRSILHFRRECKFRITHLFPLFLTIFLQQLKLHFASSLSPSHFTKQFDCLDKSVETAHSDKRMRELEQYLISYNNLVENLRGIRTGYPDIIEPVLSNVTAILYGMQIKVDLIRGLYEECNIKNQFGINLKQCLGSLVQFPGSIYSKQFDSGFINSPALTDEEIGICKTENLR